MLPNETDKALLKAAFDELDSHQLAFIGKCKTAELLDENDPDGIVVLKDESGTPHLMMSRADYEEIRRYKLPQTRT